MIVFDTNVWVALMDAADALHTKARTDIKTGIRPVLLPEYILLETCTVLAQRVSKKVADQFLTLATDNQDIEILYAGHETMTPTLHLFISLGTKNLSFVDVFLLLLSKNHTVITYGKALNKAIKTN